MFGWLNKNKEVLTILITLVPVAWTATAYIIDTNRALERERFEVYHNTIADAANGGRKNRAASQRALIYELKFFEEYSDLTCREMNLLKNQITKPETIKEINRTIEFLKCKKT